MSGIPFYDASKSYEDNYSNGPFGIFGDFSCQYERPPLTSSFCGYDVTVPFGIPAGPLLNSKFVLSSWRVGFPIAVYKTVRGVEYSSHPFPNVIKVKSAGPEIHPGETVIGDLDVGNVNVERDGITNSFAVPSKAPSVWTDDVKECLGRVPRGSLLVVSFMGTKQEGMDAYAFVEDFVTTCRYTKDTQAPVLEVNFSCPNFGKEGLVCNDVAMSTQILEALHSAKGNVPLLVKIGYFPVDQQEELERLIKAIHKFADGVSAINTITAKVIDGHGNQIFPGSSVRIVSGVCGAKIRWAGLEMAERIQAIRDNKHLRNLVVVGVGGVTNPKHYFQYRAKGVDAVMSATGAMWHPTLGQEIIEEVKKNC